MKKLICMIMTRCQWDRSLKIGLLTHEFLNNIPSVFGEYRYKQCLSACGIGIRQNCRTLRGNNE